MAKKYEIIIGGITIKRDGEDWFDAGRIRYCIDGVNEHAVLGIQAVFTDHAEEIAQAMEPMIEDLQKLGVVAAGDNQKVKDGIVVLDAILGENPTQINKRRKGRHKKNA